MSASATVADRPVRVLLVDDQAIVGESIRRMLADQPDIALEFCQDPAQAIPTANRVQPTVILQDLVMPAVDGLVLVKFFRANKATRETPMIVLSSKEEPAIKAQAFALGANDYLVKLPDKLELVARIRYHSRSYLNLLERNEAYRQLEASERRMAEEIAQAARYVESLLPPRLTEPVQVDWKYVPSTNLAGDMFGYHWLDPEHLALYVLDVSGHGVGSSLLAVSAANVLAAQSLPNTDFHDPAQVLARLNDVFQMEKQNGKYFTMWYGVFNKADRTLRYGNAGHPPALLYTGRDPQAPRFVPLEGTDPMIGMRPPGMPFDSHAVSLEPYARLLVYTDGVFEVERPDGSMWKLSDFVQFMGGFPVEEGPVAERLYQHVRSMHAGEGLADDFSVLDARL
jgi:sigma-B regulation protein RsbU (phosphoserine phosphatase)